MGYSYDITRLRSLELIDKADGQTSNCVSFKIDQSADDEWTRHKLSKMRSFLWTVLSLVAVSSGVPQRLGRQSPTQVIPNEQTTIPYIFCQIYGNCDEIDQQQLPKPYPSIATRPSMPQDECQCVPSSQCINEFGGGVIDLRLVREQCSSSSETCCRQEYIRRDPINPSDPTKSVRKGNTCGKRNPEGIGRGISGNEDYDAQYGEFPWMMMILREYTNLTKDGRLASVFICGGSLIHPQVVLTAAHSIHGKDNLIVRAGDWDTKSKDEPYATQKIKVRKVIVHEQFFKKSLLNDVALLILERPVDMSLPNVGTICLPNPKENMDNRNCVSSGWGKEANGKYHAILKKVDLQMVPRYECQGALSGTPQLGPEFKLHESFVCARGLHGIDACKGEGGSPLVCPSKNNPDMYVQAGVVAWGIGCDGGIPGVYADVPHFVNWINNRLITEGIYPHF